MGSAAVKSPDLARPDRDGLQCFRQLRRRVTRTAPTDGKHFPWWRLYAATRLNSYYQPTSGSGPARAPSPRKGISAAERP